MRPTDALSHPPDWSVRTAGASIEIRRGVSWTKDQESLVPRAGSVPVLRINNIQDRLDLKDILYVSGVPEQVRKLKKAEKDWTIIVGSNGNRNRIGNAVIIREETDFLFASFLLGAKPRDESEITPDYFYRWLCTSEVQARLSASSEGSTGLSNLSHPFFKAMEIAFPDTCEQEAITRILDAADEAIERAHAAIEKAHRVKRSFIQHVLKFGVRGEKLKDSSVGRIPNSWDCEALGGLILDGPTNGLYRPESDYGHDGIPIIRIDSFDDGEIHGINCLRRVRLSDVEIRRFALQEKDLLINRVNSLSHIGKAAVVPVPNETTVFESNMMRVRVNERRILPHFLLLVLCSDIARAHWSARARPAVNQASLNQKDVCALQIPVPPTPEQQQIVDLFNKIDRQREALQQLQRRNEAVKRGLMQDLLTGKDRVGQTAAKTSASNRKEAAS